jgi:hypothetical protein
MKSNRKPAVQLDWQVCESESGWQTALQAGAPSPAPASPARLPRRWSWLLPLVVLGLLVAGAGGLLAYRGRAGVAAVEQELHAAFAAEVGAAKSAKPVKVAQAGLSPFAAHVLGEVATDLEVLELGPDWAAARVVVKTDEDRLPQRQVRVYAHQGGAWVQIAPTAQHWGRTQALQTAHFTFDYYARDAAAVEIAAPQLDALYVEFHRAFFAEEPGPPRWQVRVDPTVPAGELPVVVSLGTPLLVASPAATLAPETISESDLLVQSVALALLQHLGDRATTRYDLPRQWRPLFSGMGLWLIWENDLALGVWRKPLVKWVLWDKQSEALAEDAHIPAFAHELCAHHRLWMELPVQIGVPVSCWWQSDAHENFLTWRFPYRPAPEIPLPQLPAEAVLSHRLKRLALIQAEEVAFATVVEYAVRDFGVGQLPVLLAELPEHESWDSLLFAVFGVSRTDFEQGWRDYLSQEYGVVCCATLNAP